MDNLFLIISMPWNAVIQGKIILLDSCFRRNDGASISWGSIRDRPRFLSLFSLISVQKVCMSVSGLSSAGIADGKRTGVSRKQKKTLNVSFPRRTTQHGCCGWGLSKPSKLRHGWQERTRKKRYLACPETLMQTCPPYFRRKRGLFPISRGQI